jgi:hypothetical protein
MSQAALAAAMRAAGFKWSQPTVAAVEKGERGLKLAEAERLIEVLGLEQLEDLVERPADAVLSAALGRMESASHDLELAALEYWDAQFSLANVLDELKARGHDVDEEHMGRWIDADPRVDVIDVAPPIAPVTPRAAHAMPGAGEWIRRLADGPYGKHSERTRG